MFLISMSNISLVSHLSVNSLLSSLHFLFNFLFLTTRPEIKTWFWLTLTDAAKFSIWSAISSGASLPFRPFVSRCKYDPGMCPANNPEHDVCLFLLHLELFERKLLISFFCSGAINVSYIYRQPSRSPPCFPYFALIKDYFHQHAFLFIISSDVTDHWFIYFLMWHSFTLIVNIFWNCFLVWPNFRGYFSLFQHVQLMYSRC